MATITITIELPDDADVAVEGDAAEQHEPGHDAEAVKRYYTDYLSDNGREVFDAAAEIEREAGPGYTFDDIANRVGKPYASVRSMHRSSGRSARKWKKDTQTKPPIRLDWMSYDWDSDQMGMRTSYTLPPGVAEQLAAF